MICTSGLQSPVVSVFMAVMNPHPIYFPQSVRSVLNQTLEDLELIIVEDPSPRSALDMLGPKFDPRVRYFRSHHRTSLVAQRNRGLSQARGEFLAILDADDIAVPTRLEKQVAYLRAHTDLGVVGSQVCIINGDGARRGYRSFPLDHSNILKAMSSIVAVCHGSATFRRVLVQEAGGYIYSEQDTAEDYDLLSRLAVRGVRFANLGEPLLQYRFHSEQLKVRRLHSTIRGVLNVKRRYWRKRMTLRDKARMWAERCLLCLPSRVLFPLLVRILYSNDVPSARVAMLGNEEPGRSNRTSFDPSEIHQVAVEWNGAEKETRYCPGQGIGE